MIESKSFGSKAFKVINAIILILLAFSCFYPLWYTFCVSISSKAAAEGGQGCQINNCVVTELFPYIGSDQ